MRQTLAVNLGWRQGIRGTLVAAFAVMGLVVVLSPARAGAIQYRYRVAQRVSVTHARVFVAKPQSGTPASQSQANTPEAPQPASSTSPDAPQRVSSTFYGLNAQGLFRLPPSQWNEQLTKLAATGVGTVRFDTGWAGVEPNPPSEGVHTYHWTRLDQIVTALAQHHLQGLPIIDYSAPWAQSSSNASEPGASPPSDPAMFSSFAQAVAMRYGPGGSFWAANPALPALPINQYEIWNEENNEYFFHGTNATLYASLYADARTAIHSVDPAATVLVGGLVPTLDATGWLNTFIAALPSHGQEIDAIGWHPYYTTSSAVYASLRTLHNALAAHSLNPPIVLTEVNSPEKSSQVSFLSELAQTLPRSDCNVTGMIVHTWMPLPEEESVGQLAIADASGNLNASGLAYSSALQAAESTGVDTPAEICGSNKISATNGPAKASGLAKASKVLRSKARSHRHRRSHRRRRHNRYAPASSR